MIRILFTAPLVYALLFVVRLPFNLLGDSANTWWGSIVAAFGMLPGIGLIYLVHQFQQYGFKSRDNPEKERGGPFAALLGFLGLLYFFYLFRGAAILVGLQGPFDSVTDFLSPYINWIFSLPEWLKKPLE